MIVRGPHDQAFYKLLDELRDECETLIAKGIHSSERSFNSAGNRLGGLSARDSRQAALLAAEKRRQKSQVMGIPGGYKLGGSLSGNTISPGHLRRLAGSAAERRARDNIWCGSGRSYDQETGAGSNSEILNRSKGRRHDGNCSSERGNPPDQESSKSVKKRKVVAFIDLT